MKGKTGELTTQQLVIIIVLIVSFGILLFFIFKLNLGENTKKQVCYNSVLLKSKSKLLGNLDCKTTYVCISGGGNCEGIYDIKKEIDLSDTDKARDQIMEVIANEMADCWWMFGEGKVDYKGTDWKGYHCAVCSVINFDSAIQEKFDKGLSTYGNFYNYLSNLKKSDTQNYLQYLYGTAVKEEALKKNEKLKQTEIIYTKEKYSVITGLNPNWPLADSIINPYLVKSEEILTKTECKVFDITKA